MSKASAWGEMIRRAISRSEEADKDWSKNPETPHIVYGGARSGGKSTTHSTGTSGSAGFLPGGAGGSVIIKTIPFIDPAAIERNKKALKMMSGDWTVWEDEVSSTDALDALVRSGSVSAEVEKVLDPHRPSGDVPTDHPDKGSW